MEDAIIIERQKPVGKVFGRGRPKGAGCNIRLLQRLQSGDSLWDVSERKMNSLRNSAMRMGISLRIRRIPDSRLYAIERINS